MRINCLGCGFKVDLDDAYDDYEGPVKCFTCEAILEIRTEQGCLKAIKQENTLRHPSAAGVFERGHSRAKEVASEALGSGPR
jgi:hypothetical protein